MLSAVQGGHRGQYHGNLGRRRYSTGTELEGCQ